ncbi:hypothetical protein NTA49_02070 [Photobacterium sp. TY 1-4]|uniref:Dihydroxy-acid dehydratase n=2 Tax=Pseudosulfitobacter koreensis TaxID=2968472 RepID=A0ABT1YWP7_9RHOB|nr:hypothetical protein [Pseudosulfitobacter koreense]
MALAGCDTGGGATSAPLRAASMANGEMILVAPEGFCIDRRSLKSSFALLARCDTLGDPDGAYGAPLGLITVSLSTIPANAAPISAAALQSALSDGSVLDRIETADAVLLRVQGTAPTREGLSATHWRGTGQVGSQRVGLAMYGAGDSAATGREGGRVLDRLMQRTRAQAAATAQAASATPAATE